MKLKLILLSALLPSLALAESTLPRVQGADTKEKIIEGLAKITNVIYAIFLAVAVLMIVVAAFNFLTAGGNAEKVGSAKKMLLYAIIAVVIAVSAQSIVILAAKFVGGSVDFNPTPGAGS